MIIDIRETGNATIRVASTAWNINLTIEL